MAGNSVSAYHRITTFLYFIKLDINKKINKILLKTIDFIIC